MVMEPVLFTAGSTTIVHVPVASSVMVSRKQLAAAHVPAKATPLGRVNAPLPLGFALAATSKLTFSPAVPAKLKKPFWPGVVVVRVFAGPFGVIVPPST